MNHRTMLCVASWLVSVTLAVPLWSQTPVGKQRRNANPRAGWHLGRQLGFVPLHQKLRQQRPELATQPVDDKRASSEPTRPMGNQRKMGNQLASFETIVSEPASELTPEWTTTVPAVAAAPAAPGGCDTCGGWPRPWVRFEYLSWWTKDMDVPALATTSPADVAQADAGVLGQPGTAVLFGDTALFDDARSGGRVSVGAWLDPDGFHGMEFSYLGLEDEDEQFSASDNTLAVLARPFFDSQDGVSDSRLIVFPNLVDGSLSIATETEFQAAEALVRRVISRRSGAELSYTLGYRYADLDEMLRIHETTTSLAAPTAGATFQLSDAFETQNQFHGGRLGLRYTGHQVRGWALELAGSVALGSTRAEGTVFGQTVTTTAGGASSTNPGGLLTQQSNLGNFETNEFSTFSEFSVRLQRQLTCQLAFTLGYDFMHWSDVLRVGDQVDLNVNTTQIPPGTLEGEPRPLFPSSLSGFWAQGLSVGLEYWF